VSAAPLDAVYKDNARYVWGLCYRMTGDASEAEDIVQETFARAVASPPARTDQPWRPWLVRVAVNLARDRLRRRKRGGYTGPWLPSPIETGEEAASDDDQERRYGMLESVSFAFLLATEILTPRQRAVLLLRDVFDYSVEEAAVALELSEANVKTTHHRARSALESYDRARVAPTRDAQARTRRAIAQLGVALAAGDVAGIEALLASGARTINDGGGEFHAARRPIIGANRVARFFAGLRRRLGADATFTVHTINGLPALVLDWPSAPARVAPRTLASFELDDDGRIGAIYVVVSTRKLRALAVSAR
jgi:RNA polymerase sigma-70 factor (ECF subfamily)